MAQIIYIKTNVTHTPAHHNMINTPCLALALLNSSRNKIVSAVFCSSLGSDKPDDQSEGAEIHMSDGENRPEKQSSLSSAVKNRLGSDIPVSVLACL